MKFLTEFLFTCNLQSLVVCLQSKIFYLLNNISILEKPDIVPFSFGRDVTNQGDIAQIMCVVSRGDRPLSITWSLKGDIINSDPTLTTTMLGTQTSILMISSVDYHHSGVYTCRAENPAGVSTHSAELKVNGNIWMH